MVTFNKIKSIILVDPMSYNNLSIYDKLLLLNLNIKEKWLIGNIKYEHKSTSKFKIKLLYSYQNYNIKLYKLLSYLYSQIKLFIFVLKIKPNIIHFQWFKIPSFDLIILYLIKFTFKSRIQIIFTAHNVLPHDTGNKFKKIYKKIYNIVDKIIVHESYARNKIINEFNISEDKIKVIPHGLLYEKNNKKEFYLKNNKKLVFSVLGNLNYYKGIDIVIDAWANSNILKNNNDILLLIAGKPDKYIKQKLNTLNSYNNVKIIDRFLEETEFINCLLSTNVLLLPYREISQSGLLLTSLSFNIPIVVSKKGGLIEPFNFGKIGWILNNNTSDELKELLEGLVRVRNEIYKIHNNKKVWNSILKYYNWKNIARSTLNFYKL